MADRVTGRQCRRHAVPLCHCSVAECALCSLCTVCAVCSVDKWRKCCTVGALLNTMESITVISGTGSAKGSVIYIASLHFLIA